MKLQVIIPVLLLFVCGCRPEPSYGTPTFSVVPNSTSLPWWIYYEKALSSAIVKTDDGLCEWEIWGRSNNEVCVWALCKVRGPIGTAGSVPAVFQLGENGEIEKIVIPRDGEFYPKDIRKLFPLDIQEKIFSLKFDGSVAEKHIDERMINNGPPLIVAAGTPLP